MPRRIKPSDTLITALGPPWMQNMTVAKLPRNTAVSGYELRIAATTSELWIAAGLARC